MLVGRHWTCCHQNEGAFRRKISKKADRKILEDILSMDCILYCHFAPPCGTASAARQIKPGPPSLRSIRFPMGFKHLKGINKQRVVAANFLYRWTKKMIVRLERAGAAWSVENPASSLMWLTDPFVELINEIPSLIATNPFANRFARYDNIRHSRCQQSCP